MLVGTKAQMSARTAPLGSTKRRIRIKVTFAPPAELDNTPSALPLLIAKIVKQQVDTKRRHQQQRTLVRRVEPASTLSALRLCAKVV